MPIIGLTDRTPSFKECGRLRLGIPKTEALKTGPKEISYFRPDFRPDAEEAALTFSQAYGNHPTRINVRLPFTDISRMWDAYYMVYNKTGLLGMSDGQRWLYLRNNQTSELLVKDGFPTNPEGLPADANGLPYMPFDKTIPVYSYKSSKGADVAVYAKPEGRLKILVPELKQAAYMTVITHSIYNIIHISEQLAAIEALAKNAGMSLPLVPMILSRRKEPISVSINGQKAMQEHYLLNIEIDPAWMEAQFKFLNTLQPGIAPVLAFQLPLPALPSPDDLSEDEPEEPVEPEPIESQESQPAKKSQLTIEEAAAMTTPKGTILGSLTDEQLTLVAAKGTNGSQEAAKYLLEKAQGDDWQAWYHLVDRAGAEKQIYPEDLPDTTSRIALYRACVDLKKAVEA